MKPSDPPTRNALSPIEETVLSISRNDPPLTPPMHVGFGLWFLGKRHAGQPLANPRLEALRRYAVLRRRGGREAELASERRRLGDLGFDRVALDEVERRTANERIVPSDPLKARRFGWDATAHPSNLMPAAGMVMGILALLWPHMACAQAERPVDIPIPLPSEDGPPPGGPGSDDHFAIGLGAIYQPAFMGSDKHRFQPLPAIDVKWGRFFVNFQDGIGLNLIDGEKVTIGAGVVMADNYRKQDVPVGIGNLPFGAGARGFVKARQSGFEVVLGGTQIFAGGTKGFVADASISYPIMVSQKLFIAPSVGTTWANGKHLNRYFGISPTQSMASGLPEYRLGSGLQNAKAELGAQYRLTERIGIGVVGGVSTLMGDAKDSPLVKSRTRPYGIFFVSYGF